MKVPIVILVLSGAVMVVMIVQTVRQELELRDINSRMADSEEDANRKEAAIGEAKSKVAEMKSQLATLNANAEELKKLKAEAEKSTSTFEKTLKTCNTDKVAALKKKTDVEDEISKLKESHATAKLAAQNEFQSLKKQVLDRDRAICAFVDMSKREVRDLCDNLMKAA